VRKLKIILTAALALLLLILTVQNREVVAVSLLFWKFEMSRVVLIVLTTVTGFLFGYLVATLTNRYHPRRDTPTGT
jgi:uncharacterized integral membrane protein